ncbi:8-amino-7-oxononanoate synthase [Diaporthe eres]|uniref:Aminotransferase class I/classII large domain-containing protein n=1 Tax=Diaporthe vaccinii TaxID=105482 RepID=A0ABR4ER98_9PEZI|nr:8-amino-7-oxononanoate synthase [Diaporthe eres]
MYAKKLLTSFREAQNPGAPGMTQAPAFYRNLELALDVRRRDQNLIIDKPDLDDDLADFASADVLSFNWSGRIREAVLAELERNPNFELGSRGTRVVNGGSSYMYESEAEIARITGAEAAYIVHSGFVANLAVLSSVPQPGDAIVYDALAHASMHEGLLLSRTAHRLSFPHNDPDGLRDVLVSLREAHKEFREGTRSVLILVESVYSMDGDVCPLVELLHVANEVFPLGNAQFLVDETHCIGLLGPHGGGLVRMLGLENKIAIRTHTGSKSLGSSGGVVLASKSILAAMLNVARCCVFSSPPSFLTVAAIRVGYQLLNSDETPVLQERIQEAVKHFYNTLTESEIYDDAVDAGILHVPSADDWESLPFVTHIVPLRTRPRYNHYLYLHLLLFAKANAIPVGFPVVPKGTERVRLVFHAHNSIEEAARVAGAICDWAKEMLEIESGEKSAAGLPTAARQALAMSGGD